MIARAGAQVEFPARFTLILTASPCPCTATAWPDATGCTCSPAVRRRYLARLSGPLLDRIDIKVRLRPASHGDVLADRKSAEPSSVVAQRVASARERAAARLAGTPWQLNGEVPGTALRRTFTPAAGALTLLERAVGLGQVSARGADAVTRVAWSLADLAGKDKPDPDEVSQALRWRLGTGAAPLK